MIPFIGDTENRQIHRDRKSSRGYPVLGRRKGELLFNGHRISRGMMKEFWKWWLYNIMNVLNASALYA